MTKNSMFSEENRLKTFQDKGWPLSFIKPEALAKCGFFYFGDSDRVKCPFCSVVVFNWQVGDDPFLEHREHSKKCPFINGRDVGNIFLEIDPRDIYPIGDGHDVCGLLNFTKKKKIIDENPEEPGIQFQPPCSVELVTYNARLATFVDWPVSELVSPAKLAEGGFYYNGPVIDYRGIEYLDFVLCFHCGISLCQWVKDDDPWVEHAKFNPDCIYIQLVARQDIIQLTSDLQSETTSTQSADTLPPEPLSESIASAATTELRAELTPPLSTDLPQSESTTVPATTQLNNESTSPQSTDVSVAAADLPHEPQNESTTVPATTQLNNESTDVSVAAADLAQEPQNESTTVPATTELPTESISTHSTDKTVASTELPQEPLSESTAVPVTTELLTESLSSRSTDVSTTSKDSTPEPETETTVASVATELHTESSSTQSSGSSTESSVKIQPFTPFCWLPKPKTEKFCCKVCLDLQVGVIFFPCLHTSCAVCASSISSCPICRASIKRVTRLNNDLSTFKYSFYL